MDIDHTKGQLISKGLFCVFNSSKKRTKIICPSRLGQKFKFSSSFFFLEELKTPKRHFEINWPLASSSVTFFHCNSTIAPTLTHTYITVQCTVPKVGSVGTNSILMGSHKIRFLHLHGHHHLVSRTEQKTLGFLGLDDLKHAKNVGKKPTKYSVYIKTVSS